MAAYQTTHTAPFGAISIFRAVQGMSSVLATLRTVKANRDTRNCLSKLSDHELNDIGLCRADIDSIGR